MPRAVRTLLTLLVASVLGVAGAGAANASAYGVTPVPAFSYHDSTGATRSVPFGCVLTHAVIGDGLDITSQSASVDCAGFAAMRSGLLCDVRFEFTYRTAGRTENLPTASVPGCRTLGIKGTNTAVPQQFTTGGKICARLVVSGDPVATSCHVVSS